MFRALDYVVFVLYEAAFKMASVALICRGDWSMKAGTCVSSPYMHAFVCNSIGTFEAWEIRKLNVQIVMICET